MVASQAKTVAAYLASLPAERRREIVAVRKMVKAHLPKGYKEAMGWGAICWEVPLKTYTKRNGQSPLCYVALVAQKNFLTLHLMGAYLDRVLTARIKAGFKEAGKRLDMGKSCIHFKRADDLPLDELGEVIAAMPPGLLILRYEELLKR